MAARISPTASITPESTVRVMDVARQFISPLPMAKELTVKQACLTKDGWFLELYGYPGQQFRACAFEVIKAAELGVEKEIPGLDKYLNAEAAKFAVPPGFEGFMPGDDRFAHG